jgi:hypothetical protein
MSRHLAQVNIGRLHAPIDDPMIDDFRNALEEINALAESSPGFVWRLQDDAGDATSFRPYDDDTIINMSTWESVDALAEYVYRTVHRDFLRRRREWFARFESSHLALWWVEAGHRPSLEEAVERIAHLDRHGPTPHAFTFAHRFGPDETDVPSDARDVCAV